MEDFKPLYDEVLSLSERLVKHLTALESSHKPLHLMLRNVSCDIEIEKASAPVIAQEVKAINFCLSFVETLCDIKCASSVVQ